MSEQKLLTTYSCFVYFRKSLKEEKEISSAFDKFISLVKENKELFPVKINTNRRRRQIILKSKEFTFTLFFGKHPSIIVTIDDVDKNKVVVNEIGTKIVNYANIIFGEVTMDALVQSMKTIHHPKKIINLGERLLGTGKIARINEALKQILKPYSISFEYKIDEKAFLFSSISNERGADYSASSTVYKGKLPFNLLEKEISEINKPMEIIQKLAEMEL